MLISAIQSQIIEEGFQVAEAVERAAMSRLRPVLMTACVARLEFILMALSKISWAKVHRPLATVVIGGLVTSTLLTLIVIPAIDRWFVPGLRPDSDDGADGTS